MSSQYIPKEKLTAYERWEVAALDEAERMAKAMKIAAAQEPPPGQKSETAPPQPAPVALSEEELEKLREKAFAEGRAAGFEDGFKSGQSDGYASGEALISAELERISAIAAAFTASLGHCEEKLADELLALALDLAAQVIRSSLKVKPELILPTVKEAMGALANPHGHPSLILHPSDAALVREHLGEQLSHSGWRIFEDTQLPQGGCKVENIGAEIDATVATRWSRAIESLGKRHDWLDAP